MAGGANPAAVTDGGGGRQYEFNFWNSISGGFVPVLYGVLAIVAWYRSPTAPGIAQIELWSGIALIVVGVALDTLRQIESYLLMRHYDGFMKSGKLRGRLGRQQVASS